MSCARILVTPAKFVTRSPSVRWTVVLFGSLVTGCGGDLVLPDGGPSSGEPAAIRVVEGDGQSGQIGGLLSAPVVVEVTDAAGIPVEGATVAFELTSAGPGAEILPHTATTDAQGHAEARVFLGMKAGSLSGEARVVLEASAVPKTTFSALATAGSPGNRVPKSDFQSQCDNLVCQFNDRSTDEDGSIASRVWRFGDGSTSEETNPSHAYDQPGSYTVTLSVTDDAGGTDESSHQVNVTAPPPPEPNKEPDADFEIHCHDRTCFFEDKSKDDDGVIASWQWDFGDGTTSREQNPVHTYENDGKYQVMLTVTDNQGASDTKDHHADAD